MQINATYPELKGFNRAGLYRMIQFYETYKVITNGTIVYNKEKVIGNRKGYERAYYYEGNYYIVTAIGSNGFIVSAYPHRKGDK